MSWLEAIAVFDQTTLKDEHFIHFAYTAHHGVYLKDEYPTKRILEARVAAVQYFYKNVQAEAKPGSETKQTEALSSLVSPEQQLQASLEIA